LAEDGIPVPGHKPIQQIAEGFDQWEAQEGGENPTTLEARKEGQKSIKPMGNFPIGTDQEGGVRTTWPITLPQGLFGLFALIRNHPYGGGIWLSPQTFEALLGGDTEAALAVVDQKTSLRRSVGWICHYYYPSQSPTHQFVACFKGMFNAQFSMLN
jgi:hypothetical protein